nr:CotH kinase family protein [Clostridia bacterium]
EEGSGGLDTINRSKDNKVPGSLTVFENGEAALTAALDHIKGRGNSTWDNPAKRPYNIKFSEKQALLGMNAAKKWTLLANAFDKSALRTAAMFELAKASSIKYNIDYRWADLYIDGEFEGLYQVCERLEVGKNRVDIDDLDKANEKANPGIDKDELTRVVEPREDLIAAGVPALYRIYQSWENSPDDISGGYLLEVTQSDVLQTERSAFSTSYGTCISVKCPEYATGSEVRYVAALYEEAESALRSADGKSSAGLDWTEYFDLPSMADSALMYELTRDEMRSWYLYVPAGERKFYAGPVWDFDRAFEKLSPLLACAGVRALTEDDSLDYKSDAAKAGLSGALWLAAERFDSFWDLMNERWAQLGSFVTEELTGILEDSRDRLTRAAALDRLRRNSVYDGYLQLPGSSCDEFAKAFGDEVDGLIAHIEKRAGYISDGLSDREAAVKQYKKLTRSGGVPVPVYAAAAGAVCAAAATAAVVVLRRKKKKKA